MHCCIDKREFAGKISNSERKRAKLLCVLKNHAHARAYRATCVAAHAVAGRTRTRAGARRRSGQKELAST